MSAVLPAHGWRELEVCAANIPGRLSHHELLKKAVALNAKLSTFYKNTIASWTQNLILLFRNTPRMGNKISRENATTKREMEEWRIKEFERQNRKSSTTPNPSPSKRSRPNHRDSRSKSDLFFSTSEGNQLDQLEVVEGGFNLSSIDPGALAQILTQTRELNEQNRRVTKKQDVFISFLEKKKTRSVVNVDWSGSKLYALDPEALEKSIDHLQEVEQKKIILPNKQVLLAVTDRVQVSRMEVGFVTYNVSSQFEYNMTCQIDQIIIKFQPGGFRSTDLPLFAEANLRPLQNEAENLKSKGISKDCTDIHSVGRVHQFRSKNLPVWSHLCGGGFDNQESASR